jgi:hypothetical protein
MKKQLNEELRRMQKLAGIITENLEFDYQEDKIVMDDATKNAILDNEELQQFITPKSFVINKTGQTVLWIDWMEPEQFDKLANFLGIKY